MILKKYKDIFISLIFLVVAMALTLFILNWEHHSLEIAHLGVFFFQLLPFVCALVAIVYFPLDKLKTPLKILLVLFSFGILFSYFIGKLIYYFLERQIYEEFYLCLQLMTPIIILSLALALRCGGMGKKDVAVFGATAIILMVSGIEDLVSQLVRVFIVPGYEIPERWTWARHMTIFTGRVLTKYEAYIFIAVHFIIIFLILYFAYTKNNLYTYVKDKIKNREA